MYAEQMMYRNVAAENLSPHCDDWEHRDKWLAAFGNGHSVVITSHLVAI
jgi:hypothetical protein